MPSALSSPESEERVVAELLAAPEQAGAIITSGLLPEHFSEPAFRLLYETAVERFYAGEAVDPVLVVNQVGQRLSRALDVPQEDVLSRVHALARPRLGSDVVGHVEDVRSNADRRALMAIVQQAQRQLEDPEVHPSEAAGWIGSSVARVATGSGSGAQPSEHVLDAGREYVRELRLVKAAQEQGIELGAYFDIAALDTPTNGLRPGELMVFAGAPGEGKSAVAWRATINFAQRQLRKPAGQRISALIMSFEMGRYPSSTRVSQMFTGLGGEALRSGRISDEDIRKVIRAFRDHAELPLQFNFSPSLRASQLRALVAEGIQRHNVGLVVVDHFRYFDLDRKPRDRNEEDDEKVRFLKEMARSLNVAVICLAHTRKKDQQARDPRPRLSDLRGSGQIAADSDFVCFLHRPYKYASEEERERLVETDAELIWEKNRHGFDGVSQLYFNPEKMMVL